MKYWTQYLVGLGREIVNPVTKPDLQPYPPCDTHFQARYHGGIRSSNQIRYIVLHTTEGETAVGAASWFATPNLPPSRQGSSNLIVSDDICFRVLSDNVIPYAAPPLNTIGFHIEIVGFSHWTGTEWSAHYKRVYNAAWRSAIRCKDYKIPVIFRDSEYLRTEPSGSGITTHAEISKAFGQTNHTDPGINFPMPMFLAATLDYLRMLNNAANRI